MSVPDARLGELVAAVVSVKPQYASIRTGNGAERVTEESVIAGARKLYEFYLLKDIPELTV